LFVVLAGNVTIKLMTLLAYLSLLVVIVGRDVTLIPVKQTIVVICLLSNAKLGLCRKKTTTRESRSTLIDCRDKFLANLKL
jgi:hypothetical protein